MDGIESRRDAGIKGSDGSSGWLGVENRGDIVKGPGPDQERGSQWVSIPLWSNLLCIDSQGQV